MKLMDFNRIGTIIDEAVEAGNIPGASVLVCKDGREKYFTAAGWADIEKRVPLRRDSIFRLYSMTKPITGAAAMLLMQDGRLDLNDPVSKYLPGFQDQKVYTRNGTENLKRAVKIKDLLSMSSGIMNPFHNSEAGRSCAAVWRGVRENMTTLEFANGLGKCGLMFQPGERWSYGASADVMAAIIEVVSGLRFGEFLRRELLGPLGMDDTDFYIPAEKQSRLAKTYNETADGMTPALPAEAGYPISLTMSERPVCEFGGAGLASTVDDYIKFARMLLNGGTLDGKKILSPKTAEYFTSPSLDNARMRDMEDWNSGLSGFNYGNFLRIMTDPGKSVFLNSPGEYGWDGALGCYFLNAPEDNLTVLFMTQRNGSGTMPVTRRIRNVVFAAI